METTIYFVRHSKIQYTEDDAIRPLSEEGVELLIPLEKAFRKIPVDRMISSPYKRAIDTIKPIALNKGLTIECYDELRERRVADHFIDDFSTFSKNQWADFYFKLPGGESLIEVQNRGVSKIQELLKSHSGEALIIGTHGTFLAIVLKYFNDAIDYDYWHNINSPDIIKAVFTGDLMLSMDKIAF